MSYPKARLGNYIDVLSGFAFKSKDFSETGVPVIKIKNISPPCVTLEDLSYVPQNIAFQNQRYILHKGDVLIAMTGSHINQIASVVGRVGRVRYDDVTVLNQRVSKIINKDDKTSDLDYIYYYLSQYDVKVELAQKAGGAANQANISPSDIKELLFPCPSIETQRHISTILSRYDALIENYQKQIKLLEEAAQRLYKEWFVDLRFPGYENVKVVDGVPEGWEKKKIDDVCASISSGSTPSRNNKSYWENGNIKWVKTKELQDGWILDTEEYITQDGYNNSSTKMFPPNTVLMAIYASPTLGRLGVLATECCCNQAALGLIADETKISWQWLWWKLYELRDDFNSIARGAGQQNISGIVVKNKMIVVPEKPIIDAFTSFVSKMFEKQKNISTQIRLLTEARDRLLPRLMGGEMEVFKIKNIINLC